METNFFRKEQKNINGVPSILYYKKEDSTTV